MVMLSSAGDPRHMQTIADVRAEPDRDKRNQLKSHLQAVSASGVFTRRSNTGLLQHSGLICIDVDHIEIERKAELHEAYPSVLTFMSPSGDGVKMVVPVEPIPQDKGEHEDCYKRVKADFIARSLPCCDALDTTSDLSRLCYLSHDPDLLIDMNRPPVKWQELKNLSDEQANGNGTKHGNGDNAVSSLVADLSAVKVGHRNPQLNKWLYSRLRSGVIQPDDLPSLIDQLETIGFCTREENQHTVDSVLKSVPVGAQKKDKPMAPAAQWNLLTNGYEVFWDTARNDHIVYKRGDGRTINDAVPINEMIKRAFRVQYRVARNLARGLSENDWKDLLYTEGMKQEINSFLAYIESLEPVGIESIEQGLNHEALTTLFTHAFGIKEEQVGADHYALLTEATRCIILGWVGRNVYPEGLQTRLVPVFKSKQQGIGKTQVGRYMLGGRFKDMIKTGFIFNNRDSTYNSREIASTLAVEFAELSGRTINPETIKSFISAEDDNYTHKYEENKTRHIRRGMFYATSNRDDPLPADTSGSARFVVFDIPPNRDPDTVRLRIQEQSMKALRVAYETARLFQQQGDPHEIYKAITLTPAASEIQSRLNHASGYQYDPHKALKLEIEAWLDDTDSQEGEYQTIIGDQRQALLEYLRNKVQDKELDQRTKLDRTTIKQCLESMGFEHFRGTTRATNNFWGHRRRRSRSVVR